MKSVKTGIRIAIGIIVGFVLMCVLCGILGNILPSTPEASTSSSIEMIEKDAELVESETNSPSLSDNDVAVIPDKEIEVSQDEEVVEEVAIFWILETWAVQLIVEFLDCHTSCFLMLSI